MIKLRHGRSSSNKNQKACKISGMTGNMDLAAFEEEFGSISIYGQVAWNELSNEVVKSLSETVVPVASFIGNKMHFQCTGIIFSSNEAGVRILTSANLVKSVDDDKAMTSILTIQVRLPNKQVTLGAVTRYDLDYNLAVILIPPYPGFRSAFFDVHMDFGSHSKVAAIGCWFNSGEFMATTGVLIDEPDGVYPEHMRISTCKIPTVMSGGPLIDSDGNFVGMNFYSRERALLLSSSKIFDFLVLTGEIEDEGPDLNWESTCWNPSTSELEHEGPESILKSTSDRLSRPHIFSSEGTSSGDSESEGESSWLTSSFVTPESVDEKLRFRKPLPVDEFTQLMRGDLLPRGYPMPTRLKGGMRLVNTFEEEFAEDIWCKLSKKVASNASRSVVSLASFKEKERNFACTGIIIDCNGSMSKILTSASLLRNCTDNDNIDATLKIQVYLPNKKLVTGTVQHCSPSYNVAVVSVEGFRCLRTAELNDQVQFDLLREVEVVAVGRVFESGKLMATSGLVSREARKLNCKDLMLTTCKITKVGIGGPLIDFDGHFLGMNFYGQKETPFLPRNVILELLKKFDAGRDVGGVVTERNPNRDIGGVFTESNPNRDIGGVVTQSNPKSNRWSVPMPRWSYPSRKRASKRPKLLMAN